MARYPKVKQRFEIWSIGPDRAVAISPELVAGEPRPGMRDLLTRRHPLQRRHSQPRIDALTRAFERGHAELTWDCMALDDEPDKGRLVNFYHRGEAIVESGATILVGVMLNVTETAIDVGDRGQARSLEQRLTREGVENATTVAAAYRYLFKVVNGLPPGLRSAIGDDDALVTRGEHPELERSYILIGERVARYREGVRRGRTVYSNIGGNLGSPGLGAMMAYLLHQVDPTRAQQFFTQWEAGIMLSARDPIHVLTHWLGVEHRPGAKGGVDVTDKMKGVILAYNRFPEPMSQKEMNTDEVRKVRGIPKVVRPDRDLSDLHPDLEQFVEPPADGVVEVEVEGQ